MARRTWSERETTRLLSWATLQRERCCIDFARTTGRTVRSVRMKLHHLEQKPETRPPSFAASTDAAAPRVTTARGPDGTPDRED